MYNAQDFINDINKPQKQVFKYGTVVTIAPITVKFDGETEASNMTIPYLKSYVPTVGDRVLMLGYNGLIIIGAVAGI